MRRRKFHARPHEEDEDEEISVVLNVESEKENSKPYYMKGSKNGYRFKAIIDSGSPVTIFGVDELKSYMKRDQFQVQEMIEGEKYVDFTGKQLKLLGYVFCGLQVGDRFIKEARILVARKGTRSIIVREWLSTLQYKVEPLTERELEDNFIERDEECCEETKSLLLSLKSCS